MANSIGLDEAKNKSVVEWMNSYLADLHVLYVKLHNLHWNIEGKQFFGMHAKLEEYYDAIAEELDSIAERVLMLGHRPPASMADFLKHAKLKELPSEAVSGAKAGEIVLADFGTMVASLRVGIEKAQAGGDEATAGALTDSLEFYEKAIWMLRAFEA